MDIKYGMEREQSVRVPPLYAVLLRIWSVLNVCASETKPRITDEIECSAVRAALVEVLGEFKDRLITRNLSRATCW